MAMIPRESLLEMAALGLVDRETDEFEAFRLWGKFLRWQFRQSLAGQKHRVSDLSPTERIHLRDLLLKDSICGPVNETLRESATKRLEDEADALR